MINEENATEQQKQGISVSLKGIFGCLVYIIAVGIICSITEVIFNAFGYKQNSGLGGGFIVSIILAFILKIYNKKKNNKDENGEVKWEKFEIHLWNLIVPSNAIILLIILIILLVFLIV